MSKQRICVMSLGIDGPLPSDHPKVSFQDFPRGIRRIREGLNTYHFTGEFIAWEKLYPEGSPTHGRKRHVMESLFQDPSGAELGIGPGPHLRTHT